MTAPLQRRLGLIDAVSMLVGIILGSGIFVAPAAIAKIAPTPGMAALMWVLGALIAVCGALCYAECGARLPMDGGFFVFFERAYSPAWAFVAGWAALFITYATSLAAVSTIGSRYAAELWPVFADWPRGGTVAILTAAAVLNLLGIQLGRIAQQALTASKVFVLIGVGLAAYIAGSPPPADAPMPDPSAGAYLSAFVVLMFTYDGWTDVTLIAGELKNPSKNLIRAVLLSLAILAAVYALVQYAVLSLVAPHEAAASAQVFATAVERGLGVWASGIIASLVLLCTAGSVHGMTWATSRLAYAMAERGALPQFFARLSKGGTPRYAVLLVYAVATIYAWLENFDELISFFAFVIWLFYAATAYALLRLRRDKIGEPLEFRLPTPWLWPSVLMAASGAMMVLQALENPQRSGVGVVILAVLAVALSLKGRAAATST